MTAPLFREAALRRFRRSPWQPPLLSGPVAGATLAVAAGLAIVGMILFALSFEHDRTVALAFEQDGLNTLAMEEAKLRGDESGRLLAPRSGRIGSIRVQPGDAVRPGDFRLDIMPLDGKLDARLYVTSAAVGSIEVGQEVRVHLDAFPYERHGVQFGRVRAVSATTLPLGYGDVRLGGVVPRAEGFHVDVEFPDGFTLPLEAGRGLRPGMTLSADIVSEYATLGDWVTSPLKGAARRL